MAIVNGSMKDIVNASMAGRAAKLFFRLNDTGVASVGSNAGTVYPADEQPVSPSSSTGNFSIDLQTTTSMLHEAFYTLRLEWLEGGGPGLDFPNWQIRVPADGGRIDRLITLGPPSGGWGGSLPNLSLVLMGLTRPENLQVGQLWWQTDPEDPNNLNGKNTGRIYRGV